MSEHFNKAKTIFADTSTEVINRVSNMMNKSAEGQLVEIIIFIMIGLVVVLFIFWSYSLTSLQDRECNKLNKIYTSNNIPVESIGFLSSNIIDNTNTYVHTSEMFDSSGGNARLFSYFVKTAYNCCSPGNFSNSFVSLCALKHCISLGARCLDFEVYSLDLEPVISTSTISTSTSTQSTSTSDNSSFYIKETFNSLSLKDVLYYIKYFALESSIGGAINHTDPLYLHFRIMTSHTTTINLIAKYLTDIIGDQLLGMTYGRNYQSFNVEPILNYCGKCIIMVYNNSSNYSLITNSQLWPMTNIVTNSDIYKLYRYSQINIMTTTEQETLKNHNKYYMSMVLPDAGNQITNFNSVKLLRNGCQFIAMNFQNFDVHLETYFTVFSDLRYSFVLKPCSLRYIPTHYLVDTSGITTCSAVTTNVTRGSVTGSGGYSVGRGGCGMSEYENSFRAFTSGGKDCSGGNETCLDNNTPHSELRTALYECNINNECGGVMQLDSTNKYYLRRFTDPPGVVANASNAKWCPKD